MFKIARLLLIIFCVGLCAVSATRAQATGVPACPAGQVPTWDNSGCMSPQTPPLSSGYGLPSGTSKSSLPGGTVNANPAMQDCNGIPIPLGQPCSAARPSLATIPLSSVPSTIAAQTPPATTASSNTPSAVAPSLGIVGVSSAGATSTVTASTPPVTSTVPGQSATVAPVAGTVSAPPPSAAALAASAAVTAEFANPMQTLQTMLGDWFTGWMQYAAAALNLSPAVQESVSTTFLSFPSCLQAQQQACEDAIWQSLSQWLGPSLPQASSGS